MHKALAKSTGMLSAFFSQQKFMKLKGLTSKLIQEAAAENSKTKADLAIVSYCLYKLLSKEYIIESKKWPPIKNHILESLQKAQFLVFEEKIREFESEIIGIIEHISDTDKEFGRYARTTLDKARAKLASSAYALGLSLSQSAYLTGASKEDLLEFIAGTKMHEEEGIKYGIEERLRRIKGASQ